MNFYKFLLISIIFWTFWATNAQAGFVLNRPLYIGLQNGLVGYWSFDGQDMNATQARDASGNANNGTLTNGPVRRIGRIGQALDFDGGDDYVDAGSDASLDNLSAFTWSAWTYAKGQPGNGQGVFIGKRSSSNEKMFLLQTLTGSDARKVQFLVNAATTDALSVSPTLTYNLNVWEHWTGTYDDNGDRKIRIYKNGQEISYLTQTAAAGALLSDATQTLKITDSFYVFNGLIDEVRVYNRALSEDEIKRLYKIGATFKVNQSLVTGNLQNGLVGYWSFDGPDMAGVTAYDRSGNSNNGTLTNGPVRRIGRIGQALNFDGSDDYVIVNNQASLQIATGTLSAWINTRDTQGSIISKDPFSAYEYAISQGGGGPDGTPSFYNNVSWVSANSAVNDGMWHHVVVTFDGTNTRFYKDGTADGTSAHASPPTSTRDVCIGRREGGTGVCGGVAGVTLSGILDDVRIYNRALAPDEIKRLYKIGATTKINVPRKDTLTEGLVGHWSFDGPDMAGVTAYDRSGQNNNGTLTNGPKRAIGRVGQALEFRGNAAATSVQVSPAGASLNITGNITISAWINSKTISTNSNIASKTNAQGSAFDYLLDIENSKLGWQVGGSFQASSQTLSSNVWYHVVGIYNGSQVIFYVNGVSDSNSYTTNPTNLNTVFSVGSLADRADYYFNGLIDEVRVYNRALSADEIKRLYNMGR